MTHGHGRRSGSAAHTPRSATRAAAPRRRDPRLERAREARRALHAHLAALLVFHADDADLERRAGRLRAAIAEFLDEPRGYLARALRAWPSPSAAQERRVDAALLRADALRDEAERIAQIHEARRELRAQLRRIEARFAARLPTLWRQLAGGGALEARIARVSTPRAALAVAESLGRAVQALDRRAADLAELEREALARVRPEDRPRLDALLRCDDLEVRLSAVLHVAAQRAAAQRAEYARTIRDATERYVARARGTPSGQRNDGRSEERP